MREKLNVTTNALTSGLIPLMLLSLGVIFETRAIVPHAGDGTLPIDEMLVATADRLSNAFRQAT